MASHPFDYITPEQVQDLWGIGFTIVKRSRHVDPFHVPTEMVPHGRSYQWWHLVHDKPYFERPETVQPSGWAPVPASRHDGYFMPFGHVGPIEVGGLGLFEKSKVEVDAEKAAQIAGAHKQTADWIKQAGIDGLSGSVSVGGTGFSVGNGENIFKNIFSKTIETTTKFPNDMLPHAMEVFAERDRLYGELIDCWNDGGAFTNLQQQIYDRYRAAFEEDPSTLKGPTLNALLLPIAVENVRTKLKEGKSDE